MDLQDIVSEAENYGLASGKSGSSNENSAIGGAQNTYGIGGGEGQINSRTGGGQNSPINQGYDDVNNGVQFQSPINTMDTIGTVVASNQLSAASYIEPPKVGMVFKTWQDVEAYYKEYAQQQGFGVTRAQGVYSKGVGRDRISTTWRCECWGRPDMRALREARKRAKAMDVSGTGGVVDGIVCADEVSQCKRKSKKCECMTKLYASVNRQGEWVVKGVELEHANHTPTPSKANLVKEYRMKGLTTGAKRKLFKFFDEGVPVTQIHGCLSTEIQGRQPKVQLTVKDLSHVVYKERRLKIVGGDSAAMMSYFKKTQGANPNFYHAQRLDQQGRLTDVIWVDARSRAAYEEFGDVVCFDATYLTNEYELPFVNFVGVNHHGQSILLGCALVSHENCDTFKWIFQEWLSCMNNRAPKAILTNQAAAMRKPIEEVMPHTRHRWCIWHIMRKIPEKLGKCERYKDFKGLLKAVVYESLTVQEFESRWSALITDYQLQCNDWLTSLFNERHMWVPAYMRDYFWAGMKTTQRVESINSFFDGFVNQNTKLFEFPQKYAKALEKCIRDETAADANCVKYVRRLVTGFVVERVFQKLYTDTKFQEVQAECSRMMYYYCKEEKALTENIIEYVVEDRVWIVHEGQSEEVITNRRREFHATFNKETKEVLCECRKFVTHGIMCKHMMRILDQNLVLDIPEQYIVSRWRKDILRKHTRVRVLHHDPSNNLEVQRYNRLMAEFEAVCDAVAMVNEEAVQLVSTAISEIRVKVDECKRQKLEESLDMSFPDDANESDSVVPEIGNEFSIAQQENIGASISCPRSCDLVVKDPLLLKKPRGRPKVSRNKTLAEMGFKKSKKLSLADSKTKNPNPTSSKNKTKFGGKKESKKGEGRGSQKKCEDGQRRCTNKKGQAPAGKTQKQCTNTLHSGRNKLQTPHITSKEPKLKSLNDLVPLISLKGKNQVGAKNQAKRKAVGDKSSNERSKVQRRKY